MKFEKNVLFLGKQQNSLSDGGVYYTLELYDKDTGSLKVNIMANNPAYSAFTAVEFGTPMTICFALRPKDKLWRITVDHVCE